MLDFLNDRRLIRIGLSLNKNGRSYKLVQRAELRMPTALST